MSVPWKGYNDAYERGPLTLFFKVFGVLLLISLVVGAVGWPLGWFSNASKIAAKEFYPEALLHKYEWFKDAAAACDQKLATIEVYDARFRELESVYAGVPRSAWARDDRNQWSIWQSEAAGIRASYNELAATYNAQMVKFNWRFTNVGDLPHGATQPLAREFKPYLEGQ